MREFENVAVPMVAPQMCVACGSSTGPMADTQRELRGWGHVYICVVCFEGVGRALGLLKGKQRQNLLASARELREQQLEREALLVALDEARLERREFEDKFLQVSDLYSVATGRIQQLEGRLTQDALEALELVGATELAGVGDAVGQ